MERQPHKFEINDKVIFDGLIAYVESRDYYYGSNKPCYNLVSVTDTELSCTAGEDECEPYTGQEIDESPALTKAYMESNHIRNTVQSLLR